MLGLLLNEHCQSELLLVFQLRERSFGLSITWQSNPCWRSLLLLNLACGYLNWSSLNLNWSWALIFGWALLRSLTHTNLRCKVYLDFVWIFRRWHEISVLLHLHSSIIQAMFTANFMSVTIQLRMPSLLCHFFAHLMHHLVIVVLAQLF
jgi:hypothetical protein